MNNKPKIVFSKTLQSVGWNTKLISDDISAKLSKLKEEPGKDLVLYAGADILATFRKLDLVDEYRLAVYPIVIGDGTPLFRNLKNPIQLNLLGTRTFKSGVVLLTYKPDTK
jgi:dihydrofolate reductase